MTTAPISTDTPPTTPVKPGWQTTEFYFASAAKLLGIAYASGLIGAGTLAERIAGLAAMVLASLGYTVSRAIVKAAAALLIIGLVGSTQISCSTVKAIPPAAAHAVVDCTRQDAGKLLAQALDFVGQGAKHLIGGEPIDWDELEAQAEHEGGAIGQCAYLETVAALHPPAPISPRTLVAAAPDPALVALERLRVHAGGVTWRTRAGDR